MTAVAVRTLLALVGGALFLDGAVLMVLRHFNLGTMLPVALGALFLTIAVWWSPLTRWRHHDRRRQQWWRVGWWGLTAWMLSVVVFWVFFLRGAGVSPAEAPPVQAIVVLGAGIQNGQPRPALAARLDTAAALARLQPEALIAVCGGQVWGTTDTEAEVMARYLQERHGIAPERLVLEKDSTSTELNLQYSLPLLQAQGLGLDSAVAVVTSDFHTLRAQRIARKMGYTRAVPVAAPTPLYIRYNAWLREYFAMASSWLLREL